MRVLKLEIKRMMKTRRTWILIAASLFLTVWMAYLPVTFTFVSYFDETGKEVVLGGREAIAYIKDLRKNTTGTVTPANVRLAIEEYQACLQEYGVTEQYDLPDGVYRQRLVPYSHFFRGIKEAFANRDTGMAASIMDIEPRLADDYYAACKERLVSLMKMEQKDNPDVQEYALDMYRNVEKPYLYYPGYNSDAMEYEGLLGMLLLLFGIIIVSPVFSSDYQTGADDILRCTKHGRLQLGIMKAVTAVGITGILFSICMPLYLVISNSFFGWECTKTSVQMVFSITSLADWNIGDMQCAVALSGLLSLIATVCFTLFLSSRCKNVITSLSAGFFIGIAPMALYLMFSSSSKEALWLRCLLPSAGLCPPSSFFYEAVDYKFLKLGGFVMWVPYAMVLFAGIEAVLFIVLAIHSYTVHEVR